jgi:hypothetical protein
VLFIGLNIVGGEPVTEDEWETRLSEEAEWTIELITNYVASMDRIGRVVIFGHADPFYYRNKMHLDFFDPLRKFIRDDLENDTPILYVNGDQHKWLYEPDFYDQRSFLRVMIQGESTPAVRVTVKWDDPEQKDPEEVFVVDRRLR